MKPRSKAVKTSRLYEHLQRIYIYLTPNKLVGVWTCNLSDTRPCHVLLDQLLGVYFKLLLGSSDQKITLSLVYESNTMFKYVPWF